MTNESEVSIAEIERPCVGFYRGRAAVQVIQVSDAASRRAIIQTLVAVPSTRCKLLVDWLSIERDDRAVAQCSGRLRVAIGDAENLSVVRS